MLRQFLSSARLRVIAPIVVVALGACGIKGPLRLPPPAQAPVSQTPAPPTNPESRPPLLPSEPPPAIVPPEPGKKP